MSSQCHLRRTGFQRESGGGKRGRVLGKSSDLSPSQHLRAPILRATPTCGTTQVAVPPLLPGGAGSPPGPTP